MNLGEPLRRKHSMKMNSFLPFFGGCLAALAPAAAVAATLTSVPMQGGMAMPMVAYHAEHGHLHVMMPEEVPQLTPLLVSNPGDQFDPADPWFDDLDPSRRGFSFSRRYGFVMDTMSDPLPPNTAIWLAKLSGPAELGFYRYSGSAPKAWEPIFGTAGSPAALMWNGMMFHPGVAAPPGTSGFTATFEAYLMDTTTGERLPDSGSGPLEFKFTNVPDGRPELAIEAKLAISWPPQTANYVLEQSATANAAEWTLVPETPVTIETRPTVLVAPAAAAKFYRLRLVP